MPQALPYSPRGVVARNVSRPPDVQKRQDSPLEVFGETIQNLGIEALREFRIRKEKKAQDAAQAQKEQEAIDQQMARARQDTAYAKAKTGYIIGMEDFLHGMETDKEIGYDQYEALYDEKKFELLNQVTEGIEDPLAAQRVEQFFYADDVERRRAVRDYATSLEIQDMKTELELGLDSALLMDDIDEASLHIEELLADGVENKLIAPADLSGMRDELYSGLEANHYYREARAEAIAEDRDPNTLTYAGLRAARTFLFSAKTTYLKTEGKLNILKKIEDEMSMLKRMEQAAWNQENEEDIKHLVENIATVPEEELGNYTLNIEQLQHFKGIKEKQKAYDMAVEKATQVFEANMTLLSAKHNLKLTPELARSYRGILDDDVILNWVETAQEVGNTLMQQTQDMNDKLLEGAHSDIYLQALNDHYGRVHAGMNAQVYLDQNNYIAVDEEGETIRAGSLTDQERKELAQMHNSREETERKERERKETERLKNLVDPLKHTDSLTEAQIVLKLTDPTVKWDEFRQLLLEKHGSGLSTDDYLKYFDKAKKDKASVALQMAVTFAESVFQNELKETYSATGKQAIYEKMAKAITDITNGYYSDTYRDDKIMDYAKHIMRFEISGWLEQRRQKGDYWAEPEPSPPISIPDELYEGPQQLSNGQSDDMTVRAQTFYRNKFGGKSPAGVRSVAYPDGRLEFQYEDERGWGYRTVDGQTWEVWTGEKWIPYE